MLEGEGDIGFDTAENTTGHLVEAGIIDPTKVLRIALDDAVSVASILLLTESTMTDIPDETNCRRPPAWGCSMPTRLERQGGRRNVDENQVAARRSPSQSQ